MTNKTHAEMIREALETLGRAKPNEVMNYIREKYPNIDVKPDSFRADMIGCSINHSSNKHYPGMPRFLYFHEDDKTYSISQPSSFGLKTRGGQSSTYNTNLAAEFYVLSTLYRVGVNAYLTLGNKKSVDIIVDKPGHNIFTVDVKGLVGRYDWPADLPPTIVPLFHRMLIKKLPYYLACIESFARYSDLRCRQILLPPG